MLPNILPKMDTALASNAKLCFKVKFDINGFIVLMHMFASESSQSFK